jgi:hypothetical protein
MSNNQKLASILSGLGRGGMPKKILSKKPDRRAGKTGLSNGSHQRTTAETCLKPFSDRAGKPTGSIVRGLA